MKNNQVIILLILGIVALLGISIYAGIFSFSDNSTNNSTTFNITPPSGYSISNQTNNTITIDNGTKQLKVRKFSGNHSIYQRIESYKSKHNITNLSVTEYYSSNSQKITKTVSDVNNITDVWYYVDKNNTVYGISTSGNVPGTDDVVKQIVDKL